MKLGFWLLLAASLRLVAALFNPGFFAYDDYQSMLRILVPAQEIAGLDYLVQESELRSPLARLPLYGVTQLALKLGVTDPLNQIRFLYVFMGAVSLLGVFWAWRLFSDRGLIREASIAAGLMSVHFLVPYISTRVMFETLPLTVLMGVAYFTQRYTQLNQRRFLAGACGLLALACLFRPVLAPIGLALVVVPLLRRDLKGFALLSIAALMALVAIGWAEQFLRGSFLASQWIYLNYNLKHSGDYGSKPFYFYLPVAFGLSGLILFVWNLKKIQWAHFRWLWPTGFVFAIFLASHSIIGHKEERFLFPALPMMLVLIAPLAATWAGRSLQVLASVSGLLALAIGLYPAQWNVVGLTRGLKPDLPLYSFQDSIGIFPKAYSSHTLKDPIVLSSAPGAAVLEELKQCRSQLVVRQDYLTAARHSDLKIVRSFEPGPLEKLIVRLNPAKNRRRDTLHLLQGTSCP